MQIRFSTSRVRAGHRTGTVLAVAFSLLVLVALAGCGGSSGTPTPGGGDGTDGDGVDGDGFASITAGQSFFLALDARGDAWGWGFNADGALGDGTTENRATPAAVRMPAGARFVQIDAGQSHGLALGEDGRAWAWGNNFDGQLGEGTTTFRDRPTAVTMPQGATFAQVSAGHLYSLALDAAGNAWAWGHNRAGKLGDGTTVDRLEPVRVTMPVDVAFTRVAAGTFRSYALDDAGDAWAWGDNTYGALGDGTTVDAPVPVRVDMPGGVAFTTLVASATHALALDAAGTAWEIGLTIYADGPPAPIDMPPATRFTEVAVGNGFSLAVDEDGAGWAWGVNYYGELGDGTSGPNQDRDAPVRIDLPEGTELTAVAAGLHASAALDVDGGAWAWGEKGAEDYGQLGDGTTTGTDTPVSVTLP